MSRVLLLCPDRIAETMAGTAARYVEMGRTLATRHEVVLAAPEPLPRDAGPFRLVSLDAPGLALEAERMDALVAQGYVLRKLGWPGRTGPPLVIDLYDPAPAANLEQAAGLPDAASRKQSHDVCLGFTVEQLLFGDFFLAGNERARNYWLGMLTVLGRVEPESRLADGSFSRLLDVVPTGVPDAPAPAASPRPDHPAYSNDARVIVWAGGIWDWMDAPTLIAAFTELAGRHPDVNLLFMGSRHPNPEVPAMGALARAQELARQTGLLDRRVFFGTWVPYASRHEYLCNAAAGVSLHGEHLEARFAWRSRLLDHLWAALPTVVTRGETLGDEMTREGAAVAVAPGSKLEVLAALELLITSRARHEEMRDHARRLADRLRWSRVIAPLQRFLAAPYHTRSAQAEELYRTYSRAFLAASRQSRPLLGRARDVLEREGPAGLIRRAARRAARAVGLRGRA